MADQFFNLALDRPARDSYGFALRPQHAQRYREYANIYKEEEDERSHNWKNFLEQVAKSTQHCSSERGRREAKSGEEANLASETSIIDGSSEGDLEKEEKISKETKPINVEKWAQIRSSIGVLEHLMSSRVKKRKKKKQDEPVPVGENDLQPTERNVPIDDDLDYRANTSISEDADRAGISEIESTEEETSRNEAFHGAKASTINADASEPDKPMKNGRSDSSDSEKSVEDGFPIEPFFSWKEELESLVRGGVPKDLRGEVWQALVGVKGPRVERYYHDLLAREKTKDNDDLSGAESKWKRQIEKDIPRTFPGHPALDENGRNSLRRLLLAYARHNPSVGYCQAMNFFAGLLLLLMPEENAFRTLVGILDDYFEGYYTEEMIESQVDQLVFEDLMRERFPKLVNHLDYLGVQVAWISGPWFLSIFVNMLPWESVLRVWDVLLYDGNRVMLFRTALALMELYGPALVTTKDAGDATTLLQNLAGSTFDSSQLVLTACMGFLPVTEARLEELRVKHRPAILEVVEERSKRGRVWKDSKGLATKLYSFKHDPVSLIEEKKSSEGVAKEDKSLLDPHCSNLDDLLDHLAVNPEIDSLPDLQEQVIWLKVELCRLLEEKRSAILRAEELETALMEMVKQDNRRQLSARVEELELELADLHQALSDKKEQEAAMLKVLMRVEQEQQVTEDARLNAEQEVAGQKHAVHVLQEKYEKAMALIAEMEKKVVMAESMLEATLQYQSGQVKAHSSPGAALNQGSTQDNTKRTSLLPFGLGWRDRNKAKPASEEDSGEIFSSN